MPFFKFNVEIEIIYDEENIQHVIRTVQGIFLLLSFVY